jgi:nucleoside-diphosphate-sugar epimerase
LWKNAAEDDPTHPKQVNYQGVVNLIQACRRTGCKRIVRITGKGEQPTSFFSVFINMLGSMAKAWNYQGELALREQSDVDYTIIRPGIMSDDGPQGSVLALKDNGGDLAVSKIRYDDVASLCIDCLDYNNTVRSTLTAMTVSGDEGDSSWGPLLAKVQTDQRVFPKNMLEQHYAAVRNTLLGIAALITSLGFAIFR